MMEMEWEIDEVVEEKEWIIETDVKMEILLLFGMMYMNCMIEEDKESRYIYKWVKIRETNELLKSWLFLLLPWNIGEIYIN